MKQRTPRHRLARQPAPAMTLGSRPPRGQWLTLAALCVALAVVVARVLMSESLRSPLAVNPGSPQTPDGAGPTSGLLLDLLAGLCPLLVLLRRAIDPTFSLRAAWSPWLLLALALWALASTAWSTDRFATAVSATHFLAAAGLGWAVVQCIAGWREVRLVSGLAVGLLVVLTAHGAWYDRMERAPLVQLWNTDPAQVLQSQNVQPGTFAAKQLQNRIENGELLGFSVSPNTYAAVLVMLGCVAIGLACDHVVERRWIALMLLLAALAAAAWVLSKTQSRTALATAAVGVVLVPISYAGRRALARFSTLLYLLGLILFLGGGAYVIGYGVARGELFHESLTFRWRYWIGAWRLWEAHPLRGVGFDNFASHYLGVRLEIAREEVKDPHNLFARFGAELGLLGVGLALAWVVRLGREITRPGTPANEPHAERSGQAEEAWSPLARLALALAAIATAGVVLNTLCSVDLMVDASYTTIELIRRAVYLVLLLAFGASAWLTLRRAPNNSMTIVLSAGPCPGGLIGIVVGLGLFFVHNLVDFSLFEPGPMFLFLALVGAALGARTAQAPGSATTAVTAAAGTESASRRRRQRPVRIALSVATAAWLLLAILVVIPTATAEASAAEADDAVRQNRPLAAAAAYEAALRVGLPNADYAARAARAWAMAGEVNRALLMSTAAVEIDPQNPGHRLQRAALLTSARPADLRTPTEQAADQQAALADLALAVQLDPNELETRLAYARQLEKVNRSADADEQYRLILEMNDRLPRNEPDRLDADTAARLRQKSAIGATKPAER